MDEEAILGGLRSGEDLPDFDYEDFEAGSTGQGRRGEDPGRDTPRSRGRYADDGDDRIFRQATDDEQTQRVRSDRSGSESGHRRGQFDFIRMAMNMARPHSDDPEAMPTRPPRSLVPGESQVSDEFEDRPQPPLRGYGFVFFWCVELLQKAEGGTSPNHTPESYPRIIPRIIPPNHTP